MKNHILRKTIGVASLAILMLAAFTQCLVFARDKHIGYVESQAGSQVPEAITITTHKPFGPVPGTFVTSGAFADSGILVTESRHVSAIPSPWGVVSHFVLRFEGQDGTFWIRTQIRETVTENELIFDQDGRWVIVDGTGAYSTVHGTGDMEGTADHSTNLITRVYTGSVHF
ncbi:MAG: hypothetical protein WBD22_08855 [Pyrinomonadaceae bacterium]